MSGSLKKIFAALAVLALSVGVAACGGSDSDSSSSGGDGSGGNLTLVAYSTPQEAYEEIIPAFNKTSDGEGVEFKQSYGPSGDQRNAIIAGLDADIAALSLEPDVTGLVDEGIVAPDWNKDKYDGFVTNSVVVFAVRKGNPKNIQTWDDLVTGDVEIITPNPFTSGGAQWNLMAAYGAQLEQGKSEEEALDFLKQILENTPVQDASARDSLQTFVGGKGDVLISYENEAILAKQNNQDIDYIVPDQTLLIETPAAVTKDAPAVAKSFLDFLYTDEAQTDFAKSGYRPVVDGISAEVKGANDPSNPYPTPAKLLTISGDFGGWPAAQKKFFDDGGIVPKIQEATGKTG